MLLKKRGKNKPISVLPVWSSRSEHGNTNVINKPSNLISGLPKLHDWLRRATLRAKTALTG